MQYDAALSVIARFDTWLGQYIVYAAGGRNSLSYRAIFFMRTAVNRFWDKPYTIVEKDGVKIGVIDTRCFCF